MICYELEFREITDSLKISGKPIYYHNYMKAGKPSAMICTLRRAFLTPVKKQFPKV